MCEASRGVFIVAGVFFKNGREINIINSCCLELSGILSVQITVALEISDGEEKQIVKLFPDGGTTAFPFPQLETAVYFLRSERMRWSGQWHMESSIMQTQQLGRSFMAPTFLALAVRSGFVLPDLLLYSLQLAIV